MSGAPRPHPGGPFAALTDAGATFALTMHLADAGRATGRFPTATWSTCLDAATLNQNLREAWLEASDGGRRDALTACAEAAARAGVAPAGFDLIPELAGADAADAVTVRLAATYARALVELAADELAVDPDRPLLPEAPWLPATGPTGIYAMSIVCDSTEPEDAKLTAAVALSAAAVQQPGQPGQQPGGPS